MKRTSPEGRPPLRAPMMTSPATRVWFRTDLCLADNPALAAAGAELGRTYPWHIVDHTAARARALAAFAAVRHGGKRGKR
jgi:deoxyribodipyrimidine photolyase